MITLRQSAVFIQVLGGLYQKFPDGKTDNTHLSVQGASKVAQLFVQDLQKQQHQLATYVYRSNFSYSDVDVSSVLGFIHILTCTQKVAIYLSDIT